MKIFLIFLVFSMTCSLVLCETKNDNQNLLENMKLKITIGEKILTATLVDNPTTRDFISQLPLTLILSDYVQAEKVSDLPKRLSTKNAPLGFEPTIGDLTYYSPWNGLAIFYKNRDYARGLIPIARIDAGVEVFSMSDSVKVTIDIIKQEKE